MTEQKVITIKADDLTITNHPKVLEIVLNKAWDWFNSPRVKSLIQPDNFPRTKEELFEEFSTFPCFAIYIDNTPVGLIYMPGGMYFVIVEKQLDEKMVVASKEFLKELFKLIPNLTKLSSIIQLKNTKYKAFLEKVGFKKEGILRKSVNYGNTHDGFFMGILREEVISEEDIEEVIEDPIVETQEQVEGIFE